MSDKRTVGEAIRNCGWTMCAEQITAISETLDAANVVVLQPGQHVVEAKQAVKGDRCLDEDGDVYELMFQPDDLRAGRWVVVRSAVTS